MYDYNFICTYKKHAFEDQEDIYRAQFLQAFGIDSWDDKKIDDITNDLYDIITPSPDLDDILNKIKSSSKFAQFIELMGDNKKDLFKLLFMFDLFDSAHNCFRDLIKDKIITPNNKSIIMNNIMNNI